MTRLICCSVVYSLIANVAFAQKMPTVVDLAAVQAIAMRDNPSLLAAEERVNQAKFRVRQAQAEWLPRIDLSATASVTEFADQVTDDQKRAIRRGQASRIGGVVDASMGNFTSIAAGLVTIGADLRDALHAVDDTDESFRGSISATWLIFDGFGRKFRNVSARFGAREIEAAYTETQRLLLSFVATAYYNVQLARENVAIAEADRAFNQRQLKESEARRRVGTGSLSDVLNFEIRIRAAETDVLQAERNYQISLIALAELMGLTQEEAPPRFEVELLYEERPDEMVAPAPNGLIVYALANRPDLARSAHLVDRAAANVKVQRSPYFPSLDTFASRDAFRTRNAFFESDDFAGTVGVRLNYNIYAGGRRRAALKEAKSFAREAELLRQDGANQVASDVRQSVETLSNAQEALVIQRETTQYVERNLELVEKEYREGQGSLVRLNEAQRDLISQRSRLALARVALRLSWHDLRTATAQTLDGLAQADEDDE